MSLFTRSMNVLTAAPPVASTITRTLAGRVLAERFVAGDTLDEAVPVAEDLAAAGLAVSLDLLGEEVTDSNGAREAARHYRSCLEVIGSRNLTANISVKLTQLGLAIAPDLAAETLDEVADAASVVGTTVTVDMEDSRYTESTIELYAEAQRRHGNLGVCLQAYLRRTPDDLARLLPLGGHIRLCKGAYVEEPDIAYQGGDDIDAAFGRLLMTLMADGGARAAVATHDPRLIELALRLAESAPGAFEFQMLYGVRPDEQRRLAAMGHDVRIYLPFGAAWYPYLTRRLAERPANLWFFLRALVSPAR